MISDIKNTHPKSLTLRLWLNERSPILITVGFPVATFAISPGKPISAINIKLPATRNNMASTKYHK